MPVSPSRGVRLFLLIAGAALLAQGSVSLIRAALHLQVPDLVLAFINADPLHAAIHITWGIVLLAGWALPLTERRKAQLVLAFGVFYTLLAFLGVLVYHPFGLHLDIGENVFHFVVGPLALWLGGRGVRGGPKAASGRRPAAGGGRQAEARSADFSRQRAAGGQLSLATGPQPLALDTQPLVLSPTYSALSTRHSAYAALRREVEAAGLLERRYDYYLGRSLGCYALFALALAVPVWLPPTPLWLAVACGGLGLASVQIGMLGHDAGHLAVFHRARANYAFGLLCWSLTLGIGFWYWRARHNAHHAHTNDADGDPEIRGSSLVAFTEADAQTREGWQRVAVRHQALLAPVLLLVFSALAVVAFRIESWLFAARQLRGGRRAVELTLLSANTLVWAAVVVWAPPQWRVVFLVGQAIAGIYLSLIVAPNHKGMPVWPAGSRPSFLERQVLSSRNVIPHPITDYLYGGLNYQIEHHLFPTMPRVNFGRARALVKPFCLAQGLAYEELSPAASYHAVWAELDRVGRAAA